MSKLDGLLIAAREVIAKGSRPPFAGEDFDDGVMLLAKREKRADETVEQALDRLIYVEKNDDIRVLYAAARRAETFVDPRPAPDEVTKRRGAEDEVMQYAASQKRAGESDLAAFNRLVASGDAKLRELYREAVA